MKADAPYGPRAVNRARVRARLLDSAESLFADHGFDGVGVRDITDHAGTRVAAVSDHFGGKEALFRDVLLRRAVPLNNRRRELLAALPRRGSRASRLRALIEAFTLPLLELADGDDGARDYLRLLAQNSSSRQPVLLLVADEFNAIAGQFIDGLRQLFPAAPDATLYDAYTHLVAAAMHTFADNLRLDHITHGRLRTGDYRERYAALIPFLEGGITALATRSAPGASGVAR
ncbi:TetR/AcrR family transcriptional regulator [Nocardia arizonensis]|uniref:TetR/AcrR family transcriptional regulator n=1 Tax=Nocardia arizonensis TaxID=1141647 RepID=UPI0006CF7D75|nr:TetR family transcriptional regulator [Nocardia arizonensis]